MGEPGILYLIPSPLDEEYQGVLIPGQVRVLEGLRFFVVENIRTSRRFIKKILPGFDIDACYFLEMDKHQAGQDFSMLINVLNGGSSAGLLSEAGCPGIADPGSQVVRLAHEQGIRVVPWIGPSSITLALMASGLNGQQFVFHGYLPTGRPDLIPRLKRVEADMVRTGYTQIFIETPYRNLSLLETLLANLAETTLLCLAIDLTGPDEYIKTQTVKRWKTAGLVHFGKKPAIFLIGAG